MTAAVPASAQSGAAALETPFLILRLETELGYALTNRQAGMSGAVYTLAPPPATPLIRLQIAYDVRGQASLARLVGPRPESADARRAWREAAQALIARLRRPEEGATDAIGAALDADLADLRPDREPRALSAPTGPPATLRAISQEGIAVLDIPVTAAPARQLRGEALHETLADATLVFRGDPGSDSGSDPETGSLRRYHAPDGRFGGGRQDGATVETGSWRIDGDSRYCVEKAPLRGFHCSAVYRVASGSLRLVPLIDGRPDGRGLRAATREFGNIGGFAVPRRADATPARVTRTILPDRTEERRGDRAGRVFLAVDGTFHGDVSGQERRGNWTVLADGRRCLIPTQGAPECAFLSETDGGTYRLFDVEGRVLGEVQYLPGDQTAR